MKRIIAYLMCFTMLMSSLVVFAENSSITLNDVSIEYAKDADASEDIKVNGISDKNVVLRIFDHEGTLEYVGTAVSSDGVFEFEDFKLEKPNVLGIDKKDENATIPYKEIIKSADKYTEKYTINYKFVLTAENARTEKDVTFVYQKTVESGGNSGGSDNEITVCDKCGTDPCVCEKKWIEDVVISTGGDNLSHIPDENYEIVGASANVGSVKNAEKMITAVTKATSKEAMGGEAARNTIAMSAETMLANIGAKKISTSGSDNKLILKENSITDADLKKYTETEKTINRAIDKNNIVLNRELAKEYIVNTSFSTAKNANITIYKGFITKLEKVGIKTLTINDKNFRVSYSLTELKEMIGDKEFTSFDVNTTATSGDSKKLEVNFNTDKTQSVTISFPGLNKNSQYMAIVDENGNPIGGRYNPATGAIEAKISESGVYQVVNNEKDFEDIKHLSEEMQESIKILAAKGIIEGTSAKEFSPEDTISRAEVAALLLRVLSQVDPNADGGFADVKKSDWYYGTAGSAKAYGMINGYEDNTFRGNLTIAKDQILTIASRILQKEMNYIAPEKPEEWLKFTDASSIADWAQKDIALATMANIVTRTSENTIHAKDDMTRGDAALIIMRLFYKIW